MNYAASREPVLIAVCYMFCAVWVYYASEEQPDPELLKWWNWKDKPGRDATRKSGLLYHLVLYDYFTYHLAAYFENNLIGLAIAHIYQAGSSHTG